MLENTRNEILKRLSAKGKKLREENRPETEEIRDKIKKAYLKILTGKPVDMKEVKKLL